MDISDRLRAARAAIGKTQAHVAAEAGMNVTQYNSYERGRSRPARSTVDRLAAALQTTAAELTGEAEHGKKEGGPTGSANAQNLDELREVFRGEVAGLLGFAPERIHVHVELR